MGKPLYCGACRKQTGTLIGTYIVFPTGTVRCRGVAPSRYRSSKDVERRFCPKCGSTIGFHRIHETSLAAGSLDDPGGFPVASCRRTHVWNRERVACLIAKTAGRATKRSQPEGKKNWTA
ncbi:MAG: GFA family protein [Gammaproteobacteria bacterium]|nr:GFA family protein [Gammaproteobacteria bacterium]